MRCKPFESAASELVPESEHPLEQLRLLDEKAVDLEKQGDIDAVIECRIKQLSLHKVLVYLYEFPLKDLVSAQVELAEAYANGSYFKQAQDHLARAKEACSGGIHDDGLSQRLHVDFLIAQGSIHFAEERLEHSARVLAEAARLVREVFGEQTSRAARVHSLLGQVARRRERFGEAAEELTAAWRIRKGLHGSEAEETLRLNVQLSEVLHADGRHQEAMQELKDVVETIRQANVLPGLLVESLTQLARWLETSGREHDKEALEALQDAETIVEESFGKEDPRIVEIKRDIALLYLKMSNHEVALQYLQHVEYLERRLHGSQATNVARTLKALGTVHMVRHNVGEAEQCLLQALRIFEADYPPNNAIIKDIRTKLSSLASGRPAPTP